MDYNILIKKFVNSSVTTFLIIDLLTWTLKIYILIYLYIYLFIYHEKSSFIFWNKEAYTDIRQLLIVKKT